MRHFVAHLVTYCYGFTFNDMEAFRSLAPRLMKSLIPPLQA